MGCAYLPLNGVKSGLQIHPNAVGRKSEGRREGGAVRPYFEENQTTIALFVGCL